MATWRLIPPFRASGPVQMAVDTWLVEQHQRGHPACLRFYTWKRPTLSLGYHQRRWPSFWGKMAEIDRVRRPTGGRAVLHQGDLTYALVMPGPPGRRSDVYRRVCEFLMRGLAALEMPVAFGGEGRYRDNPNCFGTATAADLVALATGGKRVGSAQLWRQGTLLQHGSILLYPDSQLFERVFGQGAPSLVLPPSLAQRSPAAVREALVMALTETAATCFGAEFFTAPLSTQEIQQAWAAYGAAVQVLEPGSLPASGQR